MDTKRFLMYTAWIGAILGVVGCGGGDRSEKSSLDLISVPSTTPTLPGSQRPPVVQPPSSAPMPPTSTPRPPASAPTPPASNPQPPASAPNSSNSDLINGIRVPKDPGNANNQTIQGIDSDRNGIRDDIDRFIAQTFASDPRKFQAVQMLAKISFLRYTKPEARTKLEAEEILLNHYKNSECFMKLYEIGKDVPFELPNLIEDLHSDTKKRQAFLNRAINLVNGAMVMQIEYTPEKMCLNGLR